MHEKSDSPKSLSTMLRFGSQHKLDLTEVKVRSIHTQSCFVKQTLNCGRSSLSLPTHPVRFLKDLANCEWTWSAPTLTCPDTTSTMLSASASLTPCGLSDSDLVSPLKEGHVTGIRSTFPLPGSKPAPLRAGFHRVFPLNPQGRSVLSHTVSQAHPQRRTFAEEDGEAVRRQLRLALHSDHEGTAAPARAKCTSSVSGLHRCWFQRVGQETKTSGSKERLEV